MVKANAKKIIIAARRLPELERVKKDCQAIKRDCDVEVVQLDLSEPENDVMSEVEKPAEEEQL